MQRKSNDKASTPTVHNITVTVPEAGYEFLRRIAERENTSREEVAEMLMALGARTYLEDATGVNSAAMELIIALISLDDDDEPDSSELERESDPSGKVQ